MGCPSWAMLGYALLGIGGATVIIAWPLEAERCEGWRIIRARLWR